MEDAADQWVPPGSDLRSQGSLVSGRREGEDAGAGGGKVGPRSTALAGPRERQGEGWGVGLWAKTRGEGSSSFYYSFISKPI